MYPLLRFGDRLPTVAVAQVLLNRTSPGRQLDVDGIFGPKTKAAVRSFQKPRGLNDDGVIGESTWPRLSAGTGFRVLDAIDITDDTGENAAIKKAGGSPILVGWMCNGIGQVVLEITRRAGSGGSLVLLRFHGHGAEGSMGMSDGLGYIRNPDGSKTYLEDADMTALTNGNFSKALPTVSRLTFLFGPYSSVEMHHCSVAGDKDGKALIGKLANAWGVPVSAGRATQYGGGLATFRFEGAVYSAFPGGGSLKKWAKALPAMPGMSVP